MESKQNYLSNDRLIEEIKISQAKFRKKKRESNSKDVRVSDCLTPALVTMMMLLVEKIAQHPRWRKYSYLDDMKCEANISMVQHGLKFNAAKSGNAFGYYTQIIWRTFLTFTERERKQRKIKDRIIETTPDIDFETSFAHQAEQETNQLDRDLDGTKRLTVDPIRMRRAVARRRKTVSKEAISTIDSAPVEEPSTGE